MQPDASQSSLSVLPRKAVGLARHLRQTALLLAGGLFLLPALAAPAAHSHDHAGAPPALTLNAGKKWGTDESLRKSMANIRNALETSLHAIHENKLAANQYAALAQKLDGEVAYMVKHCKLEPQADAQLHLVIAELVEGAEIMAGKAKKTRRQQGAVKVIGALENYGNYFDDPAWQPLKH